MNAKHLKRDWKLKKYSRWLGRSCCPSYKKLVRMLERELGYEIHAC